VRSPFEFQLGYSGGATEFSQSGGYRKTRGIGKNKKAMHLGFAARRRDRLGWGAHGDTVELSIYCGSTWRLVQPYSSTTVLADCKRCQWGDSGSIDTTRRV
jgi:hypothetical protein